MGAFSGPEIITQDLIFFMDFAIHKTHVSGSSIKDLIHNVSGSNNGATFSGSGVGAGYWDFDGSNDYIGVTLPAMGGESFTQEIWVKQDTFTDWQTWVSTTRSSTGFNMGTDGDGDVVWFDGSRKLEADGVMDPNDDGAGAGIWRHCAYTRDADNSNAAVAYMDGVAVDTGTIASSQLQTVGSIGALDKGSEWTNGQIALIRMYKGKAFTAAEILHNFNAQRLRFGR